MREFCMRWPGWAATTTSPSVSGLTSFPGRIRVGDLVAGPGSLTDWPALSSTACELRWPAMRRVVS